MGEQGAHNSQVPGSIPGRPTVTVPGRMVDLADVRRAREVIAPHLYRTPLLSARQLGDRIGARAYVKAESLQRTGSFKPRGAIYAMSAMPEADRKRGIVTMSAGNAAPAI